MHDLTFITRRDPATGKMSLCEGKRKIFISYKHSDEEALPLCEALAGYILEHLDVAIWYDRKLTAGKEYDDEIKSAISQSDAFILLLTPNVISSEYVLEQEIPFAIKQQVAIIPIIAGISANDLPTVEAAVGRVHMPIWFFDRRDSLPDFQKDYKDQLINGLKLAVANRDLIEQAKLFYEKGYQNVSMRYLTPEQVFVKAYGNLFGVDSNSDKSVGIKLMESIFGMYGDDSDFSSLQEQVACELLSHFYRTDRPELFFSYMRAALRKDYRKVLPLLHGAYRDQWHPEFLRHESEMSMKLLGELYRTNFNESLNMDDLIRSCPTECEVCAFPEPASELPRVGELVFNGHVAYFQRSVTEDRTVDLIIDGQRVAQYDVYASFGDVSFLYMAYDEKRNALTVLHADFDHYGPETCTRGEIYFADGGSVKKLSFISDWIKGIRPLPYTPHTFDMESAKIFG